MADRQTIVPPSFNGRTPDFESGDCGSNPCGGASLKIAADYWQSIFRELWKEKIRFELERRR